MSAIDLIYNYYHNECTLRTTTTTTKKMHHQHYHQSQTTWTQTMHRNTYIYNRLDYKEWIGVHSIDWIMIWYDLKYHGQNQQQYKFK